MLEIRRPVRIRAYRGKFTPFESTKYLDSNALKRARKATIECGTIEAALKPIGCEGCGPAAKNSLHRDQEGSRPADSPSSSP